MSFKLKLITTIYAFGLSTFLSSCMPPMTVSIDNILRETSPDRIVDVVWFRQNAGATTGYSYCLMILPFNEKFTEAEGGTEKWIFIVDKVQDLKVKWIGNKKLLIQYEKGRVFKYSNFWQSQQVENFKYTVEIFLVQKNIPN